MHNLGYSMNLCSPVYNLIWNGSQSWLKRNRWDTWDLSFARSDITRIHWYYMGSFSEPVSVKQASSFSFRPKWVPMSALLRYLFIQALKKMWSGRRQDFGQVDITKDPLLVVVPVPAFFSQIDNFPLGISDEATI